MKEKIIEEMATIALKNTMSYTCAKQIAMNFYNEGYRKVPEGGCVLSKEENENWVKWLEQNVKQARKETAEKFAKELRNFIYLCDDLELDADTYEKISNKMDELTEQCGGWNNESRHSTWEKHNKQQILLSN